MFSVFITLIITLLTAFALIIGVEFIRASRDEDRHDY